VRLLACAILVLVAAMTTGSARATTDATCNAAAAKAAILRTSALRSLWPTLRLGGGVDRVLCHDLTGDGKQDMAATIFSGGTAGDTAWVVFRRVGTRWQLAHQELHVYKVALSLMGTDLVESQPVYLANDPNCCPTGGFNHRRFHWNGSRFVVARRWHDTHRLLAAARAAPLKTPYPPKTSGTGTEPTAGSGLGAGVAFKPRFALATYDAISGSYVVYLTPKRVSCSNASLAAPPYLTVTIVTASSPLVVGAPSRQQGDKNFVQVNFFVAPVHYYTVQPHVRLVLTRVDARRGKLWHGRLTVPTTHFEGKTFSFAGTFAARWCGKS
jgi:hypothetical protein